MLEQDGENRESPLERAQRRLYAPTPVDGVRPSALSPQKAPSTSGWAPEPLLQKPKTRLSGSAIFLLFALGFFVLAGAVTAVVLYLGGRSVSGEQLTIEVDAPATVSGGEAASLLVTVRNDNPLAATDATIDIGFPEGTFAADDASKPLLRYTDTLGDIPPGGSVTRTIRATFFGEERRRLSLPITVEYTTGNSNATFVSKKTHDMVISTAPVTVSVSSMSAVSSGQPTTLTLTVRSNAVAPLANIAVQADYPFGFTPTATDPSPDGDLFIVGGLAPGEERTIRITGTLAGQEGEERVFRFTVGALKGSESREFGVSYASADAAITLARPFLAVGLSINRETADTVIIPSTEVAAVLVSWKNELSTPILDGRVAIQLAGDALDSGSVDVAGGFYRSSDRTIVFDRDTAAGLANLAPGASGNAQFTLRTKTGSALATLRNPAITMTVSVSGRRVGEDRVSETLTSTLTRTLKVATDLSVTARATRTGSITNTGPLPPRADTETTYTILLSATNTVNSVGGGSVKTTVPSYVRFTGVTNPSTAVTYDDATRTVTWTIGDLAAGASKEAAFQVALLPSTSQKGTSPALTGDIELTGFDRFIQKEVTAEASRVTTHIPGDPGYRDELGIVQ